MSVISLDEWRKKQEDISVSNSQSPQNTKSDAAGPIPTDEEELQALLEIFMVCETAKVAPFTTKSDFARTAATAIGLCATEGLISTRVRDGVYTNRWMVTSDGLDWMEGYADVFSP